MTLTLFLISIVIITFLIIYIKSVEKRKYKDPAYCSNLKQGTDFIMIINKLNDYVTWVERDKIKTKYSDVGHLFRNKAKYYKKEEKIKQFNEVYNEVILTF